MEEGATGLLQLLHQVPVLPHPAGRHGVEVLPAAAHGEADLPLLQGPDQLGGDILAVSRSIRVRLPVPVRINFIISSSRREAQFGILLP